MNYLRENGNGIAIIALAITLMIGAMYLGGCSWEDVWQVSVPAGVQRATGAPPRVSLNKAMNEVRQDFATWGERLDVAIAEEYRKMGLAKAFASVGIDQGLAAFPGAAVWLGPLMGIGGLFLRKPGDSKKMQEQQREAQEQRAASEAALRQGKEDSYNAGKEAAEKLLIPLLNQAGVNVPR